MRVQVQWPQGLARSDQLADRSGGSPAVLIEHFDLHCTAILKLQRTRVQSIRLIGKADAYERAARAFGAVHERIRNLAATRRIFRLGDELLCLGDQRIINDYAYALLRGGIVENALVTAVSVIAQHQCLGCYLNSVRGPWYGRTVGLAWSALFVIHRTY